MSYPVIKALHYIGLVALLGGPAFWYFVWRPSRTVMGADAVASRADTLFALTVRGVMVCGFILFGATAILDIMRVTQEFYGLVEWDFVVFEATESEMGQVIVARLAFGIVFLLTGLRLPLRRTAWHWVPLLLAGIGIAGSLSILSHQAGKDSTLPLVSDLVHLIAGVIWGGGLVFFSLVPWSVLRREGSGTQRLVRMGELFSTLGLLSVAVITVSGVYVATQQFYSVAAVTGTTYGAYLLRKVGLFGGILLVAAVHHFYFVPRLRQGGLGGALAGRFLRFVRLETLLLLGVLIVTGFLTTQMPPQRPVGLVSVADIDGAFAGVEYRLSAQPRESGQILFELLVQDAAGRPAAVSRAELDLTMLDHYMPPYVLQMNEAGDGVYRATGILTMGGRWHVTLSLHASGSRHDAIMAFDTRASLREAQQDKRYALSSVGEKRWGGFWLVFYGALTMLGLIALWHGVRVPRNVLLTVLGLLLFVGGAFETARVFEVPGPYSFRRNPVRRNAEVLAVGQQLYERNCLLCHGIAGRGDGPASDSLNPKPADFTSTHIQQHADGEVYWWITKGIPGSSMPGFEAVLTERERWTLVHYLRNFAGGTPPEPGPRTDRAEAVQGHTSAVGDEGTKPDI